MKQLIFPIVSALVLAACGYTQGSITPGGGGESPIAIQGSVPGFNDSVKVIFEQNCNRCHGGEDPDDGVNLETFQAAKAVLSRIEKTMKARSMPKRKQMAAESYDIVLAWIRGGAPEESIGEPNKPVAQPAPPAQPPVQPQPPIAQPEPPTSQPPVEPVITFTELSKKILEPKCMPCHTPTGRASDYDFTSYEAFIDSAVVQAGHPENSSIVKETEASGTKPPSMPPRRSGIPPLTPDEMTLLKTWISQGAQK